MASDTIGRRKNAPKDGKSRVLYLGGLSRQVSNSEIGRGKCTYSACEGEFRFPRAPRLIEYSREIAEATGAYTCVNWRSETRATVKNIVQCAERLVKFTEKIVWPKSSKVKKVQNNTSEPLILIVTDLFKGASMTYTGKSDPARKEAVRILRSKFRAYDSVYQNVGGGNSRRRAILGNATIMAGMEGEGEKAMLLQDLCAAASQVITCTKDNCHDCSRGTDSGFVTGIINSRKHDFGLSTATDKKGGVWSWK
mmetsp:Transcript_14614/g.34487  ORF Transcript_14614/g.34487 Transcript_14614/m.34487 type:complete len:252 (+) Transcript_14614:449-1204(+)|eukprot:CAMPEP_0172654546 /NCGR_PEP_ID=MMETSP1068-20121228/244391_1 /TAXON_ID=35684 /ORGANISM="Pseudopedinella elastica, Strain CCMP716" /LENGTH=251 /DNA_ID=CAMNT_0013468999 /DNA_START=428 /DNA_END=1183 /DNA_ORIENTATION=+